LITAPKLVEHQRPRHAGLSGGVVQVSERKDGHRRGLVGHDVGVRPPHHDGALLERVDQPDADGVSVSRDSRRHDLAAGKGERHLQSRRAAREVFVAST
jgi:hypothetical protein